MQNQQSSIVFDQKRASSYDQRISKLAPIINALHLLIGIILSELPADARILCVGAGTGSELIYLAQTFPQWHFTALEPAKPMLDICRQRAEDSGIASRCTFHEGYLDSLPASQSFDAATCLLVSHFIMQPEERCNFFSQIASKLRPNGYLVSSDVVSDMSTSAYQNLLEVWLRMLRYAEMPDEEVEKFRASYGRDVAVLPPLEVESIIASSGFNTPVLFFQALLIHAWYARKKP
ncbi:class I SAM-dependent methyltransferase [Tychonema sp. BBK16]|uniref:class I SAM-dependent methyltransferase n=1 Tax=Tychonema sp. BBK16 TaxID=2699888 RepID=UPI001F370A27|nr:class I SAM-dependent methyltransferase [Tychonema sp. BBK16]MCF6371420.1 class I SAM-dependent methyltransferase [Tychonema sp. BBK16]